MSAKHEHDLDTSDTNDLRRRDFVALSVATGVAATAMPAAAVPAETAAKRAGARTKSTKTVPAE